MRAKLPSGPAKNLKDDAMLRITAGALCALMMAFAPHASATSYNDDVQPILGAKCVGCHTVGSSGGHNIGSSYDDGLEDSYHCAGENVAACSIERIKDGSMPVGANCGGVVADDAANASQCVTQSEMAVLEAWLAAGLPEETACVPMSCDEGGCGDMDDGCGGTVNCGECAEGSTCTEGICVEDCVPTNECAGATCGEVDDGCGGSFSCGECPEGQGCDAGTCVEGCVPMSCDEGACGDMDDGCGGTVSCGACADGSTCTEGMCVTDEETSEEPEVTGPDYVHDVQPILGAKCAACHTTGSSGGHSVGVDYLDSQGDSYYCADLNIGACSVERIKDGSMPPGGGCGGPVADDAANADTCVTESELALLEAWVAAGMPEDVGSGEGEAGSGEGEAGSGEGEAGSGEGGTESQSGGEGAAEDEGGCHSSQGSLAWVMLLLSALLLVTQRRRLTLV